MDKNLSNITPSQNRKRREMESRDLSLELTETEAASHIGPGGQHWLFSQFPPLWSHFISREGQTHQNEINLTKKKTGRDEDREQHPQKDIEKQDGEI